VLQQEDSLDSLGKAAASPVLVLVLLLAVAIAAAYQAMDKFTVRKCKPIIYIYIYICIYMLYTYIPMRTYVRRDVGAQVRRVDHQGVRRLPDRAFVGHGRRPLLRLPRRRHRCAFPPLSPLSLSPS
jgi:hypothetical protein